MDNLPFVCYCACVVGVALFAAAALSLFSSVGYRLSGRHGMTFCGTNSAALSPFRAHRLLPFSRRQVGLPLLRSYFSKYQNRVLNFCLRFLSEPSSVWSAAPRALSASAFFGCGRVCQCWQDLFVVLQPWEDKVKIYENIRDTRLTRERKKHEHLCNWSQDSRFRFCLFPHRPGLPEEQAG